MTLKDIGLNHYQKRIKHFPKNFSTENIARIFSEHKTDWDIITQTGPSKGIILNSMRKKNDAEKLPKTGDWVRFEKLPGENKSNIIEVLPRYSQLARHLVKTRDWQIIATNIDLMFVVISVDQLFNPQQLNRYLSIAKTAKIDPIILINKTDKQKGAEKLSKEILSIHPKLKIVLTSTKNKTGLKNIENYILPGQTAVLVGNSGVGKSSLINELLIEAKQSTKEVSALGKGRHTTTRRQLFVLPKGGIIIDTPGMRTLELDPEKVNSTEIFSELESLSRQCKFRNCDHIKSAGCAILQALHQKTISKKQYEQFLNLSSKHTAPTNYNKARN